MVAGHGRARTSAVLRGHGRNNNVKSGFILARMVALEGQGGRAAHGRAMGEVDWVVVLRGRRALLAKLGKCDGDARLCYCGHESERETG